mmetsp:Transcript_38591/g.54314  ORF Transcript_38591/g.54314 Transcript_38591/m.54314 type:complete len:243 (-) Transcript_38591:304-1032(-)
MCCKSVSTSPSPSTCSVDNEKCPRQPNPVQKRIRFCVSNDSFSSDIRATQLGPLLYPSSGMSKEEKTNLWWQKSEFDNFIGSAQLLAQEALRREKTNDPQGYMHVLMSAYNDCQREEFPKQKTRHYIKQWTKVAYSRRGLEKWCVPDMAETRAVRRTQNFKRVLNAQSRATEMSHNEKIGFLRSVSEQGSRADVLFALVLAEGDAYAAEEGINTATTTATAKNTNTQFASFQRQTRATARIR